MSDNYYSKKLSASKLKQCYEIASPRVKEYLEEEIKFVVKQLKTTDIVLELGCGYGRVLAELAKVAEVVYGIDISIVNIDFAYEFLKDFTNIELFNMDANSMTFLSETFDVVVAIQNAISAFKIPPKKLVIESLRILKHDGKLILSSYSDKFWLERLDWFKAQAESGLLGEIDFEKTSRGTIICRDGFTATTFSMNDFQELVDDLELRASITEINNSSVFCVIRKK